MTTFERFQSEILRTGISCEHDVELKQYNTWKIGGKAQLLLRPATTEEVCVIRRIVAQTGQEVVWFANGSNLLFSDQGIEAAVCLQSLNEMTQAADGFWFGAGVHLSAAVMQTVDTGYSDLVFAAGIPGSVGGAIVMNAGCYGHSIAESVKSVTAVDTHGKIHIFSAKDCAFCYRTSRFQSEDWVVVGAELVCRAPAVRDEMLAQMAEYREQRKSTQPLEYPNCGSVFRNPPNESAGRLIDACSLKGYRIGGAEVSEKHANFIINRGNATAADVIAVIRHIMQIIREQYQIELQPEVKYAGFEENPWRT